MRPFLLATFLLAACGGGAPRATEPPVAGARAWASALSAEDPDRGYALLARSVQKRVPKALFAEKWREAKRERDRQATALASALGQSGQRGERARVTAGKDGVGLVHEAGGWRLESPLLYPVRADSPQAALRGLAQAIADRDVDGVLRLMSRARRERLQERLRGLARGLEQHAGDPIELVRDRAVLRWSDGVVRWRIVLVRESGEWRLDDIDSE
jgi:hypothetical protein